MYKTQETIHFLNYQRIGSLCDFHFRYFTGPILTEMKLKALT